MIMKMHSYMAINGYLRYVSQQSTEILTQLRNATIRVGGWEMAVFEAKQRREDLERETDTDTINTGTSPSPFGTLELHGGGLNTPYAEIPSAAILRNRLIRVAEAATPSETASDDDKPKDKPSNITSHVLVHHPDPQISALATEYTDLESELISSGPERVRWPDNITFKNFAVYQLIPTLVYELEFPRTKRCVLALPVTVGSLRLIFVANRIRPLYVFEKTVATFGTFALLYTVTETFILPYTNPSPDQSFARTLLDLALPFMLAYLLLFYIIFGAFDRNAVPRHPPHLMICPECICNGFAELS
jgi:sterol O-acyltransferase